MFYLWIGCLQLLTALLLVICAKKQKSKAAPPTVSDASTAAVSLPGKTMRKNKTSEKSLVVQATQYEQLTGPQESQATKVDKPPASIGGDKYLDNLFGDIHATTTQDGEDPKRKSRGKTRLQSMEGRYLGQYRNLDSRGVSFESKRNIEKVAFPRLLSLKPSPFLLPGSRRDPA